MAHRVTLIPGDGTGPELAEATRRVLEATGVEFDWDVQHAGTDVMDQNDGNPLPGARARVDPAERDRAQGADHDPGRQAASARSTSACARRSTSTGRSGPARATRASAPATRTST